MTIEGLVLVIRRFGAGHTTAIPDSAPHSCIGVSVLLDDAEGVLGSAYDGAGFGNFEDSGDLAALFEWVDEQFFDQLGRKAA